MKNYLELLADVLENGEERGDRTGVGTKSVFGRQVRFDLSDSFPLVTTKKMFWKGIVHELLWIVNGDTNISYLNDNGVHIWDEWADDEGELGPIYGKQMRSWGSSGVSIDQLFEMIEGIKNNPNSRRHVMTMWNVSDLSEMNLHPCHGIAIQFYKTESGRLSCHMYQRSADMFLGVPFNIASYSLLTYMVAGVCGLEPGEFIHSFGDAHIYMNHIDAVELQLSREPFDSPEVKINNEVSCIDDFTFDDFELVGYDCHPRISAPVAV